MRVINKGHGDQIQVHVDKDTFYTSVSWYKHMLKVSVTDDPRSNSDSHTNMNQLLYSVSQP